MSDFSHPPLTRLGGQSDEDSSDEDLDSPAVIHQTPPSNEPASPAQLPLSSSPSPASPAHPPHTADTTAAVAAVSSAEKMDVDADSECSDDVLSLRFVLSIIQIREGFCQFHVVKSESVLVREIY